MIDPASHRVRYFAFHSDTSKRGRLGASSAPSRGGSPGGSSTPWSLPPDRMTLVPVHAGDGEPPTNARPDARSVSSANHLKPLLWCSNQLAIVVDVAL